MYNTPIAYLIFNRPRHTRITFEAIRAQRPAKLFVIADGPRSGHPTDARRCREVRQIVEQIDWQCEAYHNYADTNLGCKRRVSSGLDWVYKQVDRAIILEDDCLPHPDFFNFCETLLDRYENDTRVWVITGDNFQNGQRRGSAAYYFSKYPHCWGWASWRRAWLNYQGDLPFWEEWRLSKDWSRVNTNRVERKYWFKIFKKVRNNEIDTWDYSWTASVWYNNGLTATPNVNLVTNIGFDSEGTHTLAPDDRSCVPMSPLGSITHPEKVEQDQEADQYVFVKHYLRCQEQALHKRILKLSVKVAAKVFRKVFRKGTEISDGSLNNNGQ